MGTAGTLSPAPKATGLGSANKNTEARKVRTVPHGPVYLRLDSVAQYLAQQGKEELLNQHSIRTRMWLPRMA